jgi:hypothetical protein
LETAWLHTERNGNNISKNACRILSTPDFPQDIGLLKKSFHSLAASSCSDDDLIRVLRNYDLGKKP